METCRICGTQALDEILELGRHPVSSHLKTTPDAMAKLHDLTLGICVACGIMQLMRPIHFRDLVPPFDWIGYREPEDHLDEVVDRIMNLPLGSMNARTIGLTVKDRTTLDRLSRRGLSDLHIIGPQADLLTDFPNAGVETVQALLTPDAAQRIGDRYGPAHLLIARHIAEHAADAQNFMAAVSTMLSPGGYAVIEVPDSTASLERMDYSMIWEEHVSYFTRDTLRQVAAVHGLVCDRIDWYSYPFEDVIVAYIRKPVAGSTAPAASSTSDRPTDAVQRAWNYAAGFPGWTARYRQACDALTSDGRRLAVYGAGHLTCAFLNFHRLTDYVEFVVDDAPQKQGLYLPAPAIPIVARERLSVEQISTCLLGVPPQVENKVIAAAATFGAAGGQFVSIFADSSRSIRRLTG